MTGSCRSILRGHRPVSSMLISLAALLLAYCNPAYAESRHPVTVDDLLSLKSVDPQIDLSPDGATLAYVVREKNGESLWLVSTEHGIPRTLGQGVMPRWSRDGARLAFYSARSGSLQLWICDVRDGQTTQITDVVGGIRPNPLARFTGWVRDPLRYSWSPDGVKIVFTSQTELKSNRELQATQSQSVTKGPSVGDNSTSPEGPLVLTTASPSRWALSGVFRADPVGARYVNGKFVTASDPESTGKPSPVLTDQLFVVDIATKTTERLTDNDDEYFNPEWSPDGKKIAFVSTEGRALNGYGPGTSNIYLIDVHSRHITALTTGTGEKRLPFWSPDGRWIAYAGGRHFGRGAVFAVPTAGGEPFDVTARLDRDAHMFYWSPDGSSILLSCHDGVSWPIVRIEIPSGAMERLTPSDAVYGPFTVSRTGALAWIQSDGSGDGVLYAADSDGRRRRVLFDLNPQTKGWSLGKQEVVRWKNSRAEEIEGILIKPADYQEGKSYPLIVDPYSVMSNGFMSNPMLGNQAFASEGYAVFFPNHRAPHMVANLMKNEAYSEVARGPKGVDIMTDDVMTGIDVLVKQGIVDPQRMCLYGFSNGGGAANLLVTRTSRFKCAVSAAGVLSDWSSTFFLGFMGSTLPDLIGGVTPWEGPETYIALSPVYHLDKVTTPMLLAVGDEDVHSLLLSLEMYHGLRYLGRDVTLLRYPKQGHGFEGAALEDYWQRVNVFFDSYLRP